MMDLLSTALAAAKGGISVCPPAEDGTKRPIAKWKEYQECPADERQIHRWYSGPSPCQGVGFICGRVSFGLTLFEFDDRPTYEHFLRRADLAGLHELVKRIAEGYTSETPKPGVHWLYRCPDDCRGNTKLARRHGPNDQKGRPTVQVLVETRGKGGYTVEAPSAGKVHPSGLAYRLIAGGVGSIAVLTAEEQEALWALAKSFDEMPEEKPPVDAARFRYSPGGRPGDLFAEKTTWREILEPAGWTLVCTRGEESFWRRPGKSLGFSATTNYKGSNNLYVFTTSTEFEDEIPYTKFGAWARLNHGGDMHEAAKALRRQGFGAPLREEEGPHHDENGWSDNGDELPPVEPEAAIGVAPDDEAAHCTDLGNAHRFMSRHGERIAYCAALGSWLVWDGRRIKEDAVCEMETLVKDVPRVVWIEASEARERGQKKRAKALVEWAFKSENDKAQRACLAMVRSMVAVDKDRLDRGIYVLNCLNGTLDLETGDLHPHRRSDWITKLAPVAYEPEAECPRFLAFLATVFESNTELTAFVQRALGYSLTGDVSEHVLFFLHGGGQNGKSTLLELVQRVLGDYATSVDPSVLMSKGFEQHPTALTDLDGRRFVPTIEVEDGKRLAEALVKKLTGGDRIKARRMRQDFYEFRPTHKIWLAANHKPVIRGRDEAIWRRIILIPFGFQIPARDQVRGLADSIFDEEAPGILAWLVRGCLAWHDEGLKAPESVAQAVKGYRDEQDTIGRFLVETVQLGSDTNYRIKASVLRAKFCEWSGEQPSERRFSQMMTDRGFAPTHSNGKWYTGMRWLDPPPKPANDQNMQVDDWKGAER